MYEIFFAVKQGVEVELAPHISEDDLFLGKTEKDICVNEAINRANSE